MNYTIQLLLWNWKLFIPFLLVFVPLLVIECVKQERENASKGGLLKTGLLIVPLTLVGMVLFVGAGILVYRMMGTSSSELPLILAQIVVVGLSALVEYKITGTFALNKKKRIHAVLLMFLLYMVELVLFIYIGSGMTT